MSPWESLGLSALVFLAAVIAGIINAVAGGGTIVSFPVLVWLGLPHVEANVTSSVGLWPGAITSIWGFRREFTSRSKLGMWLVLPALVGGALGAFLLLHTPPKYFHLMAPYLVLGATVFMALQRRPKQSVDNSPFGKVRWSTGIIAMLLISIYGGYFGAGLGMLLLITLSLLHMGNLNKRNGFKNLYALAIRSVAVGYFAFSGRVAWQAAVLVAFGSLAGGWLGPRLQYQLGEVWTSRIIITIGLAIGVTMIFER